MFPALRCGVTVLRLRGSRLNGGSLFCQTGVGQSLSVTFYPRDAVLARVLAMAVCLCQSVTSRCSIKRNERINLLFGMEASFDQSYTVIIFKNIHSGIYKNKGTSLWNFFLNSGIRKFRQGMSIVERATNLARER